MSLTGKTKAGSYKDILQVDNSNSGVDTALRQIKDGEGTASCAYIADDYLAIKPENDDSGAVFQVSDKDANAIFQVDSTNDLVKANGNTVNTNVQRFSLSSLNAQPASADTWTALYLNSHPTVAEVAVTAGTSSTPATTLTVDGSTILASSVVNVYWRVPFNITLDSCSVIYGADANDGDSVKFSLMSYTIDTANGSTGGDLSSGVELCASGAISGSGDEQVYYDTLTVANDDVDAGKVICAFIHSDGTDSDYSVNMQLVYHLR